LKKRIRRGKDFRKKEKAHERMTLKLKASNKDGWREFRMYLWFFLSY